MAQVDISPVPVAPTKLKSHPVDMDVEMKEAHHEEAPDEDYYTTLKNLQRQLEFYEIQVHFPCLRFATAPMLPVCSGAFGSCRTIC